MGLESATYVSDLVPANPDGTDAKNQGDNHIRMLKQVLQNTFPETDGAASITLATGWFMLGLKSLLKISRKSVLLSGPFVVTTGDPALICTLPAGYRPATATSALGYITHTSGAAQLCLITIDTSGAVSVAGITSALPNPVTSGNIQYTPIHFVLP